MTDNNRIDEELIERVEEAAREGAKCGAKKSNGLYEMVGDLTVLLLVAVVCFAGWFATHKMLKNFYDDWQEALVVEEPAEEHDLVVEDDGFLGYTAADFAEAIIKNGEKLKKVEVYKANVSDVVTVSDTGLCDLEAFTKTQVLTYNGTATYTVDLSKITEKDFAYDDDNKTLTITIPHSLREELNIPSSKIEFGSVDRGWLAWGDIEMTMEERTAVDKAAEAQMIKTLTHSGALNTADEFAEKTIWEMYQPVVSAVCPEVILKVEFKPIDNY